MLEHRFDRSNGIWRKSGLTMFAALPVMAAAGTAFAVGARVLGFVLLALAVLTAVAGFAIAVAAYNRFKTESAAFMRDATQQRRPTTGGNYERKTQR